MAQVLVRNVAPEIVEKLIARAQRNQRSLEAELRVILHDAAQEPVVSIREDVQRVRSLFTGRSFTDSTTLLREDRER